MAFKRIDTKANGEAKTDLTEFTKTLHRFPANRKSKKGDVSFAHARKFDPDGLLPQHRRFVEQYMVDGVISSAAKAAGTKRTPTGDRHEDLKRLHSSGNQILKREDVQRAIHNRQSEYINSMKIDQERVLLEFARIAFAKLTDYYVVEPSGDIRWKTPDELTEDQKAAISDIAIFENITTGTRRISKLKLHDKAEALKSLSKHLGLFEAHNKQIQPMTINIDDVLGGLPPEIADQVKLRLTSELSVKSEKSGQTVH